jgi:hypothetical protein
MELLEAGAVGVRRFHYMQEQPTSDIREFEIPAVGYAVLVTWPEMRDGKHVQDVWYAYQSEQLQAVTVVQEACGALNDAKVELLGPLSEAILREHNVPPGGASRAADSDIKSSP